MYKVIKLFTDLQDSEHEYKVGDIYPRKGYETTRSRIMELASNDNKQGTPLIEEVEDKPKSRATKKEAK